MKNLILLTISLILIFSTPKLFAQSSTGTIKWSEPYKEGGVATLKGFQLLGYEKDRMYFTKSVRDKAFRSGISKHLEYYDSATKKKKSKLLKFDEDGKHRVEKTMLLDEQVVVFTSLFNKKEDYVKLYVHLYDKEHLKKVKSLELMEIKVGKRVIWEMVTQGYFKCIPSENEEKILILGRYYDDIQCKVVNQSMEVLSETTTTVPKKNRLLDWRLNNQGDIILAGITEEEDKMQLYYCPFNKAFTSPIEVDVQGNKIASMHAGMSGDNGIIYAGFCSNKKKTKVMGKYFFSFDVATQKVDNTIFEELPVLYQMEATPGFLYRSSNFVMGDEGNHWLIVEIASFEFLNNTTVYHYEDMIVLKNGADGKMDWIKGVPKHQISTNKGGSYSYKAFVQNGKLNLLYNDHEENLEQRGNYKPKKLRNPTASNVLVLETVEDGNINNRNRKVISREYPIVYPSTLKSASDGDFHVIGEHNMQYQIGKLQLN